LLEDCVENLAEDCVLYMATIRGQAARRMAEKTLDAADRIRDLNATSRGYTS